MSGSSPPTAGKRVAGSLGAAVLGLVLLVAAWTKLIHPEGFAELIAFEGLDFLLPATILAFLGLAAEVGLGAALLLGIRRLWVLVPAALLVLFFIVLNVRAYILDAQGLREDTGCGCFGNLVDRTPAEALWQDALLLVPALLLAFLGRPRGGGQPWLRIAVVAVITAGSLVFASFAPGLPLDDLATRLSPGVEVAELCSGRGDQRLCLDTVVPALGDGRHLVVMAELGEPLGEQVPSLNDYIFAGQGPPLVVVSPSPQEEEMTFQWSYGPAFEVYTAPASLLQPLYRRLPRSFLVEGGQVLETYRGLPPQIPRSDPESGTSQADFLETP